MQQNNWPVQRFSTAAEEGRVIAAAAVGMVGGLFGLLSIDITWQPRPGVFAIAPAAVLTCRLGALPPAIRAARVNIVEAHPDGLPPTGSLAKVSDFPELTLSWLSAVAGTLC